MRMRQRHLFVLVTLAVMPSFGQAAPAVPDLSGVWAHASIPGFEPLRSGPTSLNNLSRREGGVADNRELVGDYRNPILKPDAAEIVKKHGEISRAGIGYPTPRNQCWPGGVPFVFTTTAIEFLQTRDKVTILYFEDHEVRHIRMNQPHPARVTPSWYGDSVGHFENDTLVIDTVGIKMGPHAMVDWYGTPRTAQLHVVERYRLLDFEGARDGLERDRKENFQVQQDTIDPNYRGKHLQLEFTVEDDGTFTAPWTATMTYRPQTVEWQESICSENPNKYGTEKDAEVPISAEPDF